MSDEEKRENKISEAQEGSFEIFQDLTLEDDDELVAPPPEENNIPADIPPIPVEQEDAGNETQVPAVYGGQEVAQAAPEVTPPGGGAILKRKQDIQARADELAEEGGDMGKGRMGDRLVALGIITEDQLNVALQEKKISGRLLGEVLVDLSFIDEETLSAVLA